MMRLFRYGTRRAVTACTLCFLSLFVNICTSAKLSAAPLVTAKYLQIGGGEVVAEISIGVPPPSTLIVIQNLPPHVSVKKAQPPPSGARGDKGEVKWLIKEVEAGTVSLYLRLDRSVSNADISGEIRYRESGGNMVTVPIVKP